ncbi:MAG: DUF1269 domain-containing protein [Flavobacteriaceae bacterium]
MNKMIVAVFETEEKAFEGLSALKELHKGGDISLHATAVLTKDENESISLKEITDEGPIGTAVGLLSGALIGIIGGPVGMAIGATAGMMGGMFYDLDKSGIDAGFVEEVSKAMSENKVAVVADVEEVWTAPVDTRIEQLGGMIFRRNRYEIVEDQLNREAEEINAELAELEEELKEAKDDAKASIEKQIDKAKDKRSELKNVIGKKVHQVQAEITAKNETFNKQMKEAKESNKKKLEKRIADLNADFERRKLKLNAAVQKTNEYVT